MLEICGKEWASVNVPSAKFDPLILREPYMPLSEREALLAYTQKKVESLVDRAIEDSGGVTGERIQALLEIYKRRVRAMVGYYIVLCHHAP